MTSSFAICEHAHVKSFVRAFWQTEGKPVYLSETILPKGVIEIIFSFSDPVSVSGHQRLTPLATPRAFVSGMTDFAVRLSAPQSQSFFGIELNPIAVKKLLKVPAGEFLNAIVDLEAIDKGFTSLWYDLATANSFHDRISIAMIWVTSKLQQIRGQEMAIAEYLRGDYQTMSVASLAREFCYSPRQLNRKSQEYFGMSTEALIGYKRYVKALNQIHNSTETLTGISYDCEYYDQAHFIREFKAYTELTPGEYRQRKSSLPGHVFNMTMS